MTDPHPDERPAPRWLHVWAILTTAVTLILLVLGQVVTTLGAGMADPVWPTQPGYVFDESNPGVLARYKSDLGFFVEHTHRIAGWVVGGLAACLALGAWATDPRPVARWAGLAGLVVLLAAYGQFHRGMIDQREAVKIVTPLPPLYIMAGSLAGVVALGLTGRTRGAGVRLLAVAVLVAVMAQGLLGGLRVRLNELVGPELAQYHGVFGQAVFALMVAAVAVTARRPAAPLGDGAGVPRVGAIVLVGLVFTQVIWGALVRHNPTPLSQRMHLIVAFLVAGAAVWLRLRVLTDPAAKDRTRVLARLLDTLLFFQVLLGVEAWMGKFGGPGLVNAAAVTPKQAGIRTAHALIGACLLATSVAVAVRLWVRAAGERAAVSAGVPVRAGSVAVELGGRA